MIRDLEREFGLDDSSKPEVPAFMFMCVFRLVKYLLDPTIPVTKPAP